jgi:hypothetical protein
VALSKAENKVAGAAPKPATPKPAKAGSNTTNTVVTSAEKAVIDVDNYINKKFPNIYKDKEILSSLTQEYTRKIEKMEATDAITYLNSKLTELNRSLQSIAEDQSVQKNLKLKAQIQNIITTTRPIRESLAKHTYKGGAGKILKRLISVIAIIGATDILVGGYRESKKERKNFFKTITARTGRRTGDLLSMIGITAFNVDFGEGKDQSSMFDDNNSNSTSTGYTNNLDGYKKYLGDNGIDSTKAVDLGGGRFKQDSTLDDNFIQLFKDGKFE